MPDTEPPIESVLCELVETKKICELIKQSPRLNRNMVADIVFEMIAIDPRINERSVDSCARTHRRVAIEYKILEFDVAVIHKAYIRARNHVMSKTVPCSSSMANLMETMEISSSDGERAQKEDRVRETEKDHAEESGEQQYEVEKILRREFRSNGTYYYVKWKMAEGEKEWWSDSENWVHEKNMDCDQLMEEFLEEVAAEKFEAAHGHRGRNLSGEKKKRRERDLRGFVEPDEPSKHDGKSKRSRSSSGHDGSPQHTSKNKKSSKSNRKKDEKHTRSPSTSSSDDDVPLRRKSFTRRISPQPKWKAGMEHLLDDSDCVDPDDNRPNRLNSEKIVRPENRQKKKSSDAARTESRSNSGCEPAKETSRKDKTSQKAKENQTSKKADDSRTRPNSGQDKTKKSKTKKRYVITSDSSDDDAPAPQVESKRREKEKTSPSATQRNGYDEPEPQPVEIVPKPQDDVITIDSSNSSESRKHSTDDTVNFSDSSMPEFDAAMETEAISEPIPRVKEEPNRQVWDLQAPEATTTMEERENSPEPTVAETVETMEHRKMLATCDRWLEEAISGETKALERNLEIVDIIMMVDDETNNQKLAVAIFKSPPGSEYDQVADFLTIREGFEHFGELMEACVHRQKDLQFLRE